MKPECPTCQWWNGARCLLTTGCNYSPRQTGAALASETPINPCYHDPLAQNPDRPCGPTCYGTLTETPSATEVQIGGSHYRDMKIQPIEYILANGIGFTEGNVIKYVSRWRKKNGVEDLKKARHFLDMLIEFEEQP